MISITLIDLNCLQEYSKIQSIKIFC